jgi:hypothetical protein
MALLNEVFKTQINPHFGEGSRSQQFGDCNKVSKTPDIKRALRAK